MNKTYSSIHLNFFMNNPHICLLISRDGLIQDINLAGRNIFKNFPSSHKGDSILSLIPEEKRQYAEIEFKQWQSSGIMDRLPVPILSDSDKPLHARWSTIPGNDEAHFISIFRIVGTRKQVFDYGEIQTMTQLGTWSYDYPSRNLEWSDETYRIFGQNRKDFIPTLESFYDCVHPEDREALQANLEKSMANHEESCTVKHRIIHGTTRKAIWIRTKFINRYSPEGEITASTGIVQYLTPVEDLFREYEKFFQVVSNSTVPTVITNLKGEITFYNKAVESLYGYDGVELEGKTPALFNPGRSVYLDELAYSREEYDKLFQGLWTSLTDEDIGYWEGEVLNRTKDGKLLLVYLYISTVKDEKGDVISYVGNNINISELRKEEEAVRLETYKAIATLAEKRDNETGKHMKRIGEYCHYLAAKMGMPTKFCREIRIFAPMHDIGKVGIPDNILLAERKLTPEEFSIIKTHTNIGYDILKDKPTLEMAAEIAHCHQEKYDGSGYPDGLIGKGIPLSARICTVADVYDALRSKRPYKEPFTEEESLRMLQEGRGSHFDPEIVDLFLQEREEMDRIFSTFCDGQ